MPKMQYRLSYWRGLRLSYYGSSIYEANANALVLVENAVASSDPQRVAPTTQTTSETMGKVETIPAER